MKLLRVDRCTQLYIISFLMSSVVGFAPSIDMPTTTPEPTTTTPDPETLPFFKDHKTSVNITVSRGRMAVLDCHVFRIGDRTVSWMKRDGDSLHLITFGLNTYHSDGRFSLVYVFPNNWSLQIRKTDEKDGGRYECQVSSHPPMIYTVFLDVKVPSLEVQDGRGTVIREKFFEVGSAIELQCVGMSLPPDAHLTWKKGSLPLPPPLAQVVPLQVANFSDQDKKEDDGTALKVSSAWLHIPAASVNDTGNYSCNAQHAEPFYVKLHVLDAEDSVAMQHSTNGGCGFDTWVVHLFTGWLCTRQLVRDLS